MPAHELLAPAAEEWIGADDERAGVQFNERGESGIDLGVAAGFQDMELHALRSCRLLYLLNDTLGSRAVRVHQQGEHPNPRNQLRQQLKPLSRQSLAAELADPREVAARPREAGDQPVPDRIAAMPEDNRDRRGGAFRG